MEYFVFGGVYSDTQFKQLADPLMLEHYGPFDTYEEARKVWWEKTCRNVDICEHRLFLVEENN